MTTQEAEKINGLAHSVQNLAEIVNTLIDAMVNITEEMQLAKNENITLCNRLNEIELDIESKFNEKTEPLVRPVVERRRRNITVETPYPKPNGKIKKVVDNLKRLVDAST